MGAGVVVCLDGGLVCKIYGCCFYCFIEWAVGSLVGWVLFGLLIGVVGLQVVGWVGG